MCMATKHAPPSCSFINVNFENSFVNNSLQPVEAKKKKKPYNYAELFFVLNIFTSAVEIHKDLIDVLY